ncbi:hypothetical protein Zm00014a_039103 [Zea mays]|uniref:Uncharacterized protein n=1 Tax=Zea mays TaxID=4577 RepID=A0A3L6FLP7_MAIZE|nr:hypothetical protein Zm00014a_039103 [Zea mays]
MPQVDLESLVCGVSGAGAGAGDRKVSCETVIAGGSGDASPPPDPDLPPESITIPIGDDAAFSELNPIYERDDSTKGSTNPKFAAAAAVANPVAAKTRSNSTRVAGAPPPPAAGTTFFGLPARIRPTFTRRRPSQGRILHGKRAGGGGGGGEVEPRSPKVSCIGKVLSDRERHGRRRRGWWYGVAAMFRCDGCARVPGAASRKKVALEDDDGRRRRQQQQPGGIAGMRRFKSGRRAASWGDEALAAAATGGDPDEGEEEPDSKDAGQWSRRPVT